MHDFRRLSLRCVSVTAMMSAAVLTAGVPALAVCVIVVAAPDIGIVAERSRQQRVHRRVCLAAGTACAGGLIARVGTRPFYTIFAVLTVAVAVLYALSFPFGKRVLKKELPRY